jgi:hypothetical protein
MLGPLDKDLRDPGRWGPMGTHVSHIVSIVGGIGTLVSFTA